MLESSKRISAPAVIACLAFVLLASVFAPARAELWGEVGDLGYGSGEWAGRFWVDVNGDGRTDFCRIPTNNVGQQLCTLAGPNGWGQTYVAGDVWAGTLGAGTHQFRTWVDVDGDGVADYCRMWHGSSSGPAYLTCSVRWTAGANGTASFGGHVLSEAIPYVERLGIGREVVWEPAFVDARNIAMGDVNGDGRGDLCHFSLTSGFQCHLSTGSGFAAPTAAWTIGFADGRIGWGDAEHARGFADVNGDGFADYCRIVGSTIRCIHGGPNGFAGDFASHNIDVGYKEGAAFVDFNGDGKTDYCRVVGSSASAYVRCLLSAGSGWSTFVERPGEPPGEMTSPALDWGYSHARWWVDINGDGLSDFCRAVGNDPNQSVSVLSCRLSRGGSFGFSDVASEQISFGEQVGRSFCDANGDGINEYCRVAYANQVGIVHAGLRTPDPDPQKVLPVHARQQLMTRITDGLGARTLITYLPLTHPDVYTRDGTSRWPDQVLTQPPSYVVYDTRAERADGVRLTGRSLYHYRNLRADTQGHGSRGFEERRMLNQGNNTLERVFFYQGLERGTASTADLRRQVLLDVGQVRQRETYVMNPTSGQGGKSALEVWAEYARATAAVAAPGTEPSFPSGHLIQWASNDLPRDTAPMINPRHRFVGRTVERTWDMNGTARVAMPTVSVTTVQDAYGNITSLDRLTQHNGLTWQQITTNTFDNGAGNISNWLLGRLTNARVESRAPSIAEQFAQHPRNAGGSPYAADTTLPLPVIAGATSVSGSRPNPGSASIGSPFSVSSGLSPYTFSWTRVSGSRITFSPANTLNTTFSATLGWGENLTESFRLTVIDASGRSVTGDVAVTFTTPAQLSVSGPVSVTGSRPSPGAASATATPTAAGGVPPYSFSWTRVTGTRITVSGSNPATFAATLNWSENLTETFRVTAADSAGNSATRDVNVTFTTPAQLVVTGPASVSGSRPDPGTLAVNVTPTASGGTPPYAYTWARIAGSRIGVAGSNPATFSASVNWSENFTETFRVTTTDAAGVTATRDVNVTFTTPPQLLSSISPTIVRATRSGAGFVSATATVSASGGTPGYSFTWSRETGSIIAVSGGQTATFSATLAEGQSVTERFRVTVTDSAGVQSISYVDATLAAPGPLSVSASPSSVSGFRWGAGSMSCWTTLTPSGGLAPHSFSVARLTGSRITASVNTNTVQFSVSLNGFDSVQESFRITVVDSTGAQATRDINANFVSESEPGINGRATCYGSSNPLNVVLSPNPLVVSAPGPGTRSGTVNASGSGGTAPYSFSWTRVTGSRIVVSGTQTATFSANVGWGESFTEAFRATVTDATGAQNIRDINVTFTTPGALTVSASPANPSASRAGAGSVSVSSALSASGGTPPYSYSWARLSGSVISVSGGQTGTFSANLAAGTSVTENFRGVVTDAGGNQTFADVSVALTATAPPPVSATVSPSPLSSTGNGTWSQTATVSVSGGVAPFSFGWTQLSGSTDITVSGGQTATFTGWAIANTWCEPGFGTQGVFRVTVTDSAGQVVTRDLAVYFNPAGPSGPPIYMCP
ncbi:hypothetical protein FBR04_16325 [Betaproteobacteria bacterium PRO7]|jgi:hypothetical protein|nr:hypothetical protein [Betaproteobacteria bacterium PRO7]